MAAVVADWSIECTAGMLVVLVQFFTAFSWVSILSRWIKNVEGVFLLNAACCTTFWTLYEVSVPAAVVYAVVSSKGVPMTSLCGKDQCVP